MTLKDPKGMFHNNPIIMQPFNQAHLILKYKPSLTTIVKAHSPCVLALIVKIN